MRAAAARKDLWNAAHRLCAAAERRAPGLTLRARALATAPTGLAVNFADVLATPEWLDMDKGSLEAFSRLVGAVVLAGVWRSMIDGAVLRAVSEALGEDVLRRILEISSPQPPTVRCDAAERGEAAALEELGYSAMVAALTHHPALLAFAPSTIRPAYASAFKPERAQEIVATAMAIERAVPGP